MVIKRLYLSLGTIPLKEPEATLAKILSEILETNVTKDSFIKFHKHGANWPVFMLFNNDLGIPLVIMDA